jgi:hypothetical protein
MNPRHLRTAAATAVAVFATLAPAVARADHSQESIFQDDDHLVYTHSAATVNHMLDLLQSLGVDRVRVTVKWSAIAPDPLSRTRPAHFAATDPAAYPASSWTPYDRILTLAESHGIGVDFNVTAPGPLWAMKHGAPVDKEADHYAPSVQEFAQFVYTLGVRYSGTYTPAAPTPSKPKSGGGLPVPVPLPVPVAGLTSSSSQDPAAPAGDPPATPLPRVHYWTLWNEPNIDGWLSPQWRTVRGHTVVNSPRLYRQYVDAAFGSLGATGHTVARDTILIGETAPEGYSHPTAYPEMEPMPFLRALYCVDGAYHQLRGIGASALGCPASSSPNAFVAAHPALFTATGYAHHPYYFFFPPDYISSNTGFVPIANLSRLEGGLDRLYRRYGVHRKLPVYLTEYGYQTYPDPLFGAIVSLAQQATYLNQADYMAWRDPRVRSVAQFLMYDAGPPYASTFQTGLLFASGARKPAYAAYRLPLWATSSSVRRGGRIAVWGQLRPGPDGTAQSARIQWSSGRGGFRTIASVSVRASSVEGYFTASVKPPATGVIRLAWRSPAGRVVTSRQIPVTVG